LSFVGSYDQTHICIEIKVSHSIAFLGLPRPRRRYSLFGVGILLFMFHCILLYSLVAE